MKEINKLTVIGWAGFIIMLVLFFQRCGADPKIITTNTHDTIVHEHYDSVPKIIHVKIKGPSGIITIHDTSRHFSLYWDTSKVELNYPNYFALPFNDTTISGTIFDTIYNNQVLGQSIEYRLLNPTLTTDIITNTAKTDTIIMEQKRALYLGGFLSSNTSGTSIGIGPQVSFATQKNTLYHINYDLLQKRIEIGAHIKLSWPK